MIRGILGKVSNFVKCSRIEPKVVQCCTMSCARGELMNNILVFICVSVISLAPVAVQSQTRSAANDSALPYTPSLDVNAMDRSVDPCVDLYHYSCGGWQKNNP